MRFADLPGYGYAKVSKKKKNAGLGLSAIIWLVTDIALVFQLIDMRHPPTKDDLLMIDYLVECEMPFAVVLTKMDKLSQQGTGRAVGITSDGNSLCRSDYHFASFCSNRGRN